MSTFDPKYASRSMLPSLPSTARLKYIKNELDKLLDMLDGDEDCKWIYKAIIQLSITHRTLEDKWPVAQYEINSWISKLRILDPLREGRWNDLEESVKI